MPKIIKVLQKMSIYVPNNILMILKIVLNHTSKVALGLHMTLLKIKFMTKVISTAIEYTANTCVHALKKKN